MQIDGADLLAFKQMFFEIVRGNGGTSSIVEIYSSVHGYSIDEGREKLRKEVMDFLEQRYHMKRRYGNLNLSFDRFVRDSATIVETIAWLLGLLFPNQRKSNSNKKICLGGVS